MVKNSTFLEKSKWKIGCLFGQQLSESQGKQFVISCTVLYTNRLRDVLGWRILTLSLVLHVYQVKDPNDNPVIVYYEEL